MYNILLVDRIFKIFSLINKKYIVTDSNLDVKSTGERS